MTTTSRRAVVGLVASAVLGIAMTAPALAAGNSNSKGTGNPAGGFSSTTSSASCNDGTVSASPAILWPPNHKLHAISISYSEKDGDGDSLSITAVKEAMVDGSGAANVEGHGAGQPATQQGPDYVGPTSYSPGTDGRTPASTSVQIRSERAGTVGNGSGRVYALTVTCHDSGGSDPAEMAGQDGTGTVYVCVPHDMSDASVTFCKNNI